MAAVLLLSGCFHYVPAAVPPLPTPNAEVRVTLAKPIDVPMGEFTLHDVTRIDGIVTEANGDTLGLMTQWLHPRMGRKYDARMMGSYGIPVTEIQQLEQLRLSPKRTAIVLGVAAITVALFFRLTRPDRSGSGIEPPPPDDGPIVGRR